MPNVTKKLKLEQQDPGEEPRNVDRDSPIPLKNLGNTCYENSIIQCLFSLNMFMDNFELSMERMRQFVIKSQPRPIDASNSTEISKVQAYIEDGVEQNGHDEPTNQEQKRLHDDQQLNDLGAHIEPYTFSTNTTIDETDVRYRISNAFDNLWKSYTKKRNQIESNNQNTKPSILIPIEAHQNPDLSNTSQSNSSKSATIPTSTCLPDDLAINNVNDEAIPLCKSNTTTWTQTLPADGQQTIPKQSAIETLTASTSASAANLTPIALMSSASDSTPTVEQSEIETRLEELKSAVGERSSQFNSTHQQDASEFFYHVIDSIQEFYQSLDKTNEEDNPVTKAFELELDYMIKCPKCHHQVMTEPERIRTLPLALPHINNQAVNSPETVTRISNPDEFINGTNGAPTPPTSDLGLDSPELNSFEERRLSSDEKENNQALVDEEIHCEDNNLNTTMSIENLDLTDNNGERKVQVQSTTNQSEKEIKPPSPEQPQSTSKHYTLNDALNNYFKDDVLDCNCSQDNCDAKQRIKKCLIRKLPQVLFITLARYSYTGKKNLDEIEAPFQLSVPFRENKSPSHSPSAHSKFENYDCNNFQLVAVVCHLGSSLNAGHYTSYVYNQNNFSWYSCDDDSITKVQEADVKSDATKSGYCFFYAHTSCINQRPEEVLQDELVETNKHEGEVSTDLKHKGAINASGSVPDSSVVLTPESSPKSSPSPTREVAEAHPDHTCCMDNNYIDDWS